MTERPLSRQPDCRYCEHEEHILRCELELDCCGAICPCPPHLPVGIYA